MTALPLLRPPAFSRRTSRLDHRALLILLTLLPAPALSQVYVSPSGNDSNSGSIDDPFLTLAKAHSVIAAGDTIYVRGGIHVISATMTLSKSGTTNTRYHVRAYPGERPVFDCSSMATSSSNRGLRVSGSYWSIYGIDIAGAGDNGLNMSGSNNIVEWCAFYRNRDSGVQLDNGASNNHFINCDSYYNADPTFENADGFAPKLTVGSGNKFTGCRAWQNVDDGWDGYLRGADSVFTILENCWSFNNGYLENGTPSLPNGDGNGFKMGGSDLKDLHHNMTLVRCLAFDNRVKGFDQNNNRGSMTIINGTSFRNGTNYSLPGPIDTGYSMLVANSLVFGALGNITSAVSFFTNSWDGTFSVDSSDFESLDTTGARGPRGPDGALPFLPFLRLAYGSDLVNSGSNMGYPFVGGQPDIGAFETDPAVSVDADVSAPRSFVVHRNYPNPFNASTIVPYEIGESGRVIFSVYDIVGRLVFREERSHEHPGRSSFRWSGKTLSGLSASGGFYVATVTFNGLSAPLKLLYIK